MSKETLLLIDDEEDILSVTQMMLEAAGFTVLCTNSPRKGVEMYREHFEEIKAVLVDLIMPEMDGRKVFQELKNINKDVKAILVSGYNNDDIKNHLYDEGFAGLIQKPYEVEYLLNKIRTI